MNVLGLCAGGLGLERGLREVVPGSRAVCLVEREAFAIANMVSAMEEGILDPAPIWTDVHTFSGVPWYGLVDCVAAGYPCTPFSHAGLRRGTEDPAHLWPSVARIIRECEPWLVVLENVPFHLRKGGREVVGELQELGFETAAVVSTAAEFGALHRRERLFIVAAHPDRQRELQSQGSQPPKWRRFGDGGGEDHPWSAEPDVGRVADGVADRSDRLRLLGNGVVPQQAARSVSWALEALGVPGGY